ncbi:MAG: DNA polymerase III subunit delta [Clostridia bacterium]
MRFINFSKNLNENTLEKAYILQGEDAYFVKSAKSRILSTCKIENEEINLSSFDETKKDEFFSSLNSYPLMSKYRASVISIDKPDDDFFKKFEKYAENINPECVAIVVNNGKSVTEKDGIYIVDCAKENMPTLSRWVSVTFRKNGKSIDDKLAEKLVERCNFDMMKISNAVEAISCYLSKNSEVTESVIDELAPFEIEAQIFDLSNAIVEKNVSRALALYSKFKSQKIDDTQIIALLYGNYRRMFLSAVSDLSNEEVAAELKVKPYSIKKARELARKTTKARLKKCLDILINLENGIKSGKMTNPDIMQVGILTLIEK